MWLLLAFLTVPLIEIALFIQVGGWIGLWLTLAIVVLTAVIGTWLMRTQGALALSDVKRSLSGQSDPTEALAHGAMILVAGVLLLTPGFFTDAVGFALLTPAFRRAAFAWLRKRVHVTTLNVHDRNPYRENPYRERPGRPPRHGADTIEGEYHEVDPPANDKHAPSGWTKH